MRLSFCTTRLLIILAAWLLVACAIHTPQWPPDAIETRLRAGGFSSLTVPAPPFVLSAAERPGTGRTLLVVIEGDGFAYRNRAAASRDPTPRNPVGLSLALASGGDGPVAYLGRPCQWAPDDLAGTCTVTDWTKGRFSQRVLGSMNAALDVLKRRSGADNLALAGYSGGAQVALLLQNRRADVRAVVTIAGVVDHARWTRYHDVEPLSASVKPVAPLVLRQIHVVGGRDRVSPPVLLREWSAGADVDIIELPDATHGAGYLDLWRSLSDDLTR